MSGNELVYVIHFDRKYWHAQHYVGTTTNLERRLEQHRKGRAYGGGRLMEVIITKGIGWQVVSTLEGGRELELQIKAQKNSWRYCPICIEQRQKKQHTESDDA